MKKRKERSSYEGRQGRIRKLKTPKIEVWRNKYPDREYMIKLETAEFTCICPKTGLPDFANIRINYIPDKNCIELKSFKYYFNFFRDMGIFHEHVINKILEDFVRACNPRFVRIEGEFNPRGGITTTVSQIYKRR
ncbi:MAG: preQ(1) synthase [Candidatus Omnitrophota bacterium]|nr:preQ(1) synthase [Candidatus Omnitrophota bacterium]